MGSLAAHFIDIFVVSVWKRSGDKPASENRGVGGMTNLPIGRIGGFVSTPSGRRPGAPDLSRRILRISPVLL
jgi:hypothetical protein